MKKIFLYTLVTTILIGVVYFIYSKYNEIPVLLEDENISTQDNISWSIKRITDSSGDVPTYNLNLTINNQSFNINDYWKEPLYGCRNFVEDRPGGTNVPAESLSDQLCYFMGGGNLFYVVKKEGGYQVLHKTISDGMPEQPATLLIKI